MTAEHHNPRRPIVSLILFALMCVVMMTLVWAFFASLGGCCSPRHATTQPWAAMYLWGVGAR